MLGISTPRPTRLTLSPALTSCSSHTQGDLKSKPGTVENLHKQQKFCSSTMSYVSEGRDAERTSERKLFLTEEKWVDEKLKTTSGKRKQTGRLQPNSSHRPPATLDRKSK
ncbi:hypothetical protein CHARACLAT_022156 [Characodon lateralis]|uniref:Uncharacterized protein n=1 Tax=Characodon lateralis TaxID=208331 RepID=A0ABU7E4I4_9TELE|nr:hypothetical protein [Characodon lateralis]